jgi:hypothetical protein
MLRIACGSDRLRANGEGKLSSWFRAFARVPKPQSPRLAKGFKPQLRPLLTRKRAMR